MTRLLLPALFLLASICFTQAQSTAKPVRATFYYNNSWELTSREKYFFKREAVFDFVNMVFDGSYRDYNKDGVMIAEGYYNRGEQTGFQTEFFNNRTLHSSIEFQGDDFTIWEFRDENKQDSIHRGTGSFKISYFYLAGLVSQPSWKLGALKGTFQSGKRTGTWVYEDLGNKKTDEEYYDKGKLLRRIHYSDAGTSEFDYKKEVIISLNSLITETLAYDHSEFNLLNEYFEQEPMYPATLQREVTYPGGIRRLLLLLAQNVVVPEGNLCKVRMRLDERGKVLKYAILESASPEIDDQTIYAIKNHEKRFLPALKNGIPYPAYLTLPVSSGSRWLDFVRHASLEEIMAAE